MHRYEITMALGDGQRYVHYEDGVMEIHMAGDSDAKTTWLYFRGERKTIAVYNAKYVIGYRVVGGED